MTHCFRIAVSLACLWLAGTAAAGGSDAALKPGEARISPATERLDRVERDARSGEVRLLGTPLESLIGIAYAVHPLDVVYRTPLPREQIYDVVALPAPSGDPSLGQTLQTLLEDRFGIRAGSVTRNTHVSVLRPLPDWPPLEPSQRRTQILAAQRGLFRAQAVPIERLVAYVRSFTQQPIVDESDLPARYDLVLEWDTTAEPYSLVQAFQDLGLEMSFEKRDYTFLEVRKRP